MRLRRTSQRSDGRKCRRLEAAHTANPNLVAILSFTAQYYGQLGYELSTLDSISNQNSADGSNSLFWELLVNGTVTQTGMDTTNMHDYLLGAITAALHGRPAPSLMPAEP